MGHEAVQEALEVSAVLAAWDLAWDQAAQAAWACREDLAGPEALAAWDDEYATAAPHAHSHAHTTDLILLFKRDRRCPRDRARACADRALRLLRECRRPMRREHRSAPCWRG
jgi:4'-phosphopantetheinyl transferase EntD